MQRLSSCPLFLIFFFNDTATTEIYTLSLHDALPIWRRPAYRPESPNHPAARAGAHRHRVPPRRSRFSGRGAGARSEEHTSELQSQSNLVCRLLLEKQIKLQKLSRATPSVSLPSLPIS